ncbi:hypothetical protein Tco_1203176 [Tanacetum coccineum]
MAPLPHHDLRHPWLKFQVDGYDKGIVHSYEQRLETIRVRPVNRVHVLDLAGLTDGMKQTLGNRLSMVYVGDDGEALFTSHVWRRLFEMRAPLVREFILEWRMNWRAVYLALGFAHLLEVDDGQSLGFGVIGPGSERVHPNKGGSYGLLDCHLHPTGTS